MLVRAGERRLQQGDEAPREALVFFAVLFQTDAGQTACEGVVAPLRRWFALPGLGWGVRVRTEQARILSGLGLVNRMRDNDYAP